MYSERNNGRYHIGVELQNLWFRDVSSLCNGCSACVKWKRGMREYYKLKRGLRQGSKVVEALLSPLFFDRVNDKVIEKRMKLLRYNTVRDTIAMLLINIKVGNSRVNGGCSMFHLHSTIVTYVLMTESPNSLNFNSLSLCMPFFYGKSLSSFHYLTPYQ